MFDLLRSRFFRINRRVVVCFSTLFSALVIWRGVRPLECKTKTHVCPLSLNLGLYPTVAFSAGRHCLLVGFRWGVCNITYRSLPSQILCKRRKDRYGQSGDLSSRLCSLLGDPLLRVNDDRKATDSKCLPVNATFFNPLLSAFVLFPV